MIYLITFVHIVVALFLIIVVLLQSGKAADLAGAFGGMGSQTAFGPRGSATLLSKATTVAAALFMCTSMTLAILATRRAGGPSTVLESAPASQSAPAQPQQQQPAQPGGQPSVTITPEGGGPSRTIPLDVTPPEQAPAKPQKSEPAKPQKK
jgi:preprotein translocase subunit SecG